MAKIRNGFVSNSSSSSFLIVGTSVDAIKNLENVIKNMKKDIKKYYKPKEYNTKTSKELFILAGFDEIGMFADQFNLFVIGKNQAYISIKKTKDFLMDHSINEAKEYFANLAKKNNIEVDEKDIFFDYGEVWN